MQYEYLCQNCHFEWEFEQKINDPKLTTCPSCKQESAKRLISLCSFTLKGGGWAKEGYASGK